MTIDSVTFVSEKTTSTIRRSRSDMMRVDLDSMQGLPQILGNTDPLHFVKLLPGVQTVTEFDSGIRIRGCESSHNDVTVGGVPLYGVNHLLGLFSIFNPRHYPEMTFSTSSSSNRLGGTLRMELPDTLHKKVTGDVSVGMVSTQASVGVRPGRNSHLRASFRQSYLGLIYSRWMKVGKSSFGYDFGDYNLTYLYTKDPEDRVWVDLYMGMDKAAMSGEAYGVNFKFDWGNYKGSVHWEHKGEKILHRHSIYSSGYGSECNLIQTFADMRLPSYIMSAGYKGELLWKDVESSMDLTWYDAMPQVPLSSGMTNIADARTYRQNAFEATLSADYVRTFADRWGVRAGLKGTCWYNPEKEDVWRVLPAVALSYDGYNYGKVTASYGWSQQNLFYTGLSSSGLPIEFWFLAGRHSEPQYSQWVDLSYDLQFCRNMFSLSCGLYAKKLYNQVEYHGDIMDMFTKNYDLDTFLLKGRGYNFGLNVMLHKQSGDFTGWVSYSLGRALRKFDNPEYQGWYPSNHERIHELNAVCSYKYRRWDFSGTFIYATGLPFTAPKSYYLSSGQLIAEFGEHNACRMRPYIRLDLSVSCSLMKNERHENGINISIVNALARKNDVMYKLKVELDEFYYYRQHFFLTVIPSISYYHKF